MFSLVNDKPATIKILKWLQLILATAFIGMHIVLDAQSREYRDIPPAVAADEMRILSLGETEILAKLLSFWLLSFDSQSGNIVDFDALNYDHLTGWLETIQSLDPRSHYANVAANGIFIEVKNPAKAQKMVEFIRQQFHHAPNERWYWLAQSILHAKYRLNNLPLALLLARDMRAASAAPAWARDMELLILQDMGEYEAAKVLILGILEHRAITDPHELKFLTSKLKELEQESLQALENSSKLQQQ